MSAKPNFDIKKHIESHSELTLGELGVETITKGEYLHFKTSIDTAQFLANGHTSQEAIDAVMKNILNDLFENGFVANEKNGVRQTKKGEVQKYTKREIDFKDVLFAYHSRDVNENYTVEPHFHILADPKKRFGINHSLLKKALQSKAQEHGLVFHFAEEKRSGGRKGNKNLQTTTTRFSWQIQRMSDVEFREYFTQHSDEVRKRLSLMYERTCQDGNLQFYLKTFQKVQNRLEKTETDFEFMGENLRHQLSLPLSEKDIYSIKVLQSGKTDEINKLLRDRDNLIARDYVKYCHGFSSPIIDRLNKSYSHINIKKIHPRKLDLSGMLARTKKHLAGVEMDDENGVTLRKGGKVLDVGETSLNYYDSIKADFMFALDNAVTDGDIRLLMEKMGYVDFGWRTKDRKKIGFKFINKREKKQQLYFNKLGIDPSILQASMLANKKRHEDDETYRKARKRLLEAAELDSKLQQFRYDESETRRINKSVLVIRSAFIMIGSGTDGFENVYGYKSTLNLDGYNITQSKEKGVLSVKNHKRDIGVLDKGEMLTSYNDGTNAESVLERVRIMYEMAMAKGWSVNDIKLEGSAQFIKEAQRAREYYDAHGVFRRYKDALHGVSDEAVKTLPQ